MRVALLLMPVLLLACQSNPLLPWTSAPGYSAEVRQGLGFSHQVVIKQSVSDGLRRNRPLHVYIEGDGRPWYSRYEVAVDPTPRNLPVMELMSLDPAPALYLGRPCYFFLSDPLCAPVHWTHGRYSEEIVQSMSNVLDQYRAQYTGFRLIGHSGGGALAMLLAARRSDVEAVVTLAGNLDIDSWAVHHGYTPLAQSLNPVFHPPAASVRQWHFAAERDETVPAQIIGRAVGAFPGAHFSLLQDMDHNCCWRRVWPAILQRLSAPE